MINTINNDLIESIKKNGMNTPITFFGIKTRFGWVFILISLLLGASFLLLVGIPRWEYQQYLIDYCHQHYGQDSFPSRNSNGTWGCTVDNGGITFATLNSTIINASGVYYNKNALNET